MIDDAAQPVSRPWQEALHIVSRGEGFCCVRSQWEPAPDALQAVPCRVSKKPSAAKSEMVARVRSSRQSAEIRHHVGAVGSAIRSPRANVRDLQTNGSQRPWLAHRSLSCDR